MINLANLLRRRAPADRPADPLYLTIKDLRPGDLARLPETADDLEDRIAACADTHVLGQFVHLALQHMSADWAVVALRRLVELDPEPQSIRGLIIGLSMVKRFAEANALLDQQPDWIRADNRVKTAAELLFVAEGRLEDARRAAVEPNRGSEDDRQERRDLQLAYVVAESARGQHKRALALARAANDEWPKSAEVKACLARCLFRNGDTSSALALCRELGSKHNTEAMEVALGQCEVEFLVELGEYHQALDRAEDILSRFPQTWPIYHFIHAISTLAGRQQLFADLIDRLREMDLADPEAVSLVALCDAEEGNESAVEEKLSRLKRLSPSTYYQRAVTIHAAMPRRRIDRIEAAYAAAVSSGYSHELADLGLAMHLYFGDGRPAALGQALDLMSANLDRWRHIPSHLLLYLRLLIALRRTDDLKAAFDELAPGIKKTKHIRIIELYLLSQDGDDESAERGWVDLLAECKDPALTMPASLPETVSLKWRDRPGAILLFCVIFNGVEYVDWLVNYYRELGVDHFFFTDNGSTDGTYEYLVEQPDVSVFQSLGSFARAGAGLAWTNHLIRRFGNGHWCVHVDMDEALVFPGMEDGRSLREFLNYLDANGYRSVRSAMIDIYPESVGQAAGEDPFAASCWIDTDYGRMPSEMPPYEIVNGGLRARVTSRNLMMNKAPLLKVNERSWYLLNNHYHTHVPVADVSTAVLHYKFIGNFHGRVSEAIERREHFLGAFHYKGLLEGLSSHGSAAKGGYSVRYRDPAQLVDLGIIDDSAKWRSRRWN